MLWSNRIRMGEFLEAVGHKSYDLLDLLACDPTVPFNDVVDACAFGETFKNDGNGQAGVA
jgi:hypothetical protein